VFPSPVCPALGIGLGCVRSLSRGPVPAASRSASRTSHVAGDEVNASDYAGVAIATGNSQVAKGPSAFGVSFHSTFANRAASIIGARNVVLATSKAASNTP
jgi:hypothetical protein